VGPEITVRERNQEEPVGETNPPPAGNSPTSSILQKAYAQLEKLVENIVSLRVTTVVGTVTAADVADPSMPTRITIDPAGQLVAHSAINTALGDANIVMSKGFLEDEALNKLHAQALADSRAIRKESVDMLRSAIDSLVGTTHA
jgi:hypothetical protein